jgi:hypothetical protein
MGGLGAKADDQCGSPPGPPTCDESYVGGTVVCGEETLGGVAVRVMANGEPIGEQSPMSTGDAGTFWYPVSEPPAATVGVQVFISQMRVEGCPPVDTTDYEIWSYRGFKKYFDEQVQVKKDGQVYRLGDIDICKRCR